MQICEFVSLVQAVRDATGEEPHKQTLRSWVKKGLNGIRLEAVFIRGQYRTTPENVLHFLEAVTAAKIVAKKRVKS
jgi:hypothetical protein